MFFSKKRNDEEQTDKKKYLTYEDGEVKEFNSEEEIKTHSNRESQQERKPLNLKSKALLVIGISLIVAPLVISGVIKGGVYIKEYKNFMVTGDDKTNPQTTPNEEVKPEDVEKPTTKKFSKEEIEAINNKFNEELVKWYSYLKTDLVNYRKGVESVYSTQKNLEYKLNTVNTLFAKISNEKAEFIKKGATELYNIYNKRVSNYTNGINSMLKDLNRTSSTEIFNSILEQDKKDSILQEEALKKYLKD